MECEGIEEGRIMPNKPNLRYVVLSTQLLKLQSELSDFLSDPFTDVGYYEYMSKYLQRVGKLMGVKPLPLKFFYILLYIFINSFILYVSIFVCCRSKEKESVRDESYKEEVEPVVSDRLDESALKEYERTPARKKLCLEFTAGIEQFVDIDDSQIVYRKKSLDRPTQFREIIGDGNCLHR